VLQQATKNASCYAATALISVRFVPVLKPEDLNLGITCTLYVPKFVKPVPLSAQSMPGITFLVKNVRKHVKNVQQFAMNLQVLPHKQQGVQLVKTMRLLRLRRSSNEF
jgi:hypothetical protein